MTIRLPPLCLIVLSLMTPSAGAAMYGAASTSMTASPDSQWLLKVVPGTFRNDPTGKEPPRSAQATTYRFDASQNAYVLAATFWLRNEHAPKTAMISNDGEFVITLDDWEPKVGTTGNAVVVYKGTGEYVRSWTLEEFLTPDDLKKANRPMINSLGRYWNNGRPNFSGQPSDRTLLIWPPDRRLIGVRYVLDLRALHFTPQIWRRAPYNENID